MVPDLFAWKITWVVWDLMVCWSELLKSVRSGLGWVCALQLWLFLWESVFGIFFKVSQAENVFRSKQRINNRDFIAANKALQERWTWVKKKYVMDVQESNLILIKPEVAKHVTFARNCFPTKTVPLLGIVFQMTSQL